MFSSFRFTGASFDAPVSRRSPIRDCTFTSPMIPADPNCDPPTLRSQTTGLAPPTNGQCLASRHPQLLTTRQAGSAHGARRLPTHSNNTTRMYNATQRIHRPKCTTLCSPHTSNCWCAAKPWGELPEVQEVGSERPGVPLRCSYPLCRCTFHCVWNGHH